MCPKVVGSQAHTSRQPGMARPVFVVLDNMPLQLGMWWPWWHGAKGEPATGQCPGGFGQPKMVGPVADASLGMPKGMGTSSGMEDACCEHSDASLTHWVEDGSWGCATTLDGPGVAWPVSWRPSGMPKDVGLPLGEHRAW